MLRHLSTKATIGYIPAQLTGGWAGAVVANLMFSRVAFELSTKTRSNGGLWLAEVVATFGLLLVIFGVTRSGRASAVPIVVGAYIGGAYLVTASTSFGNPAVTFARMFTDTFAGIRPASAPALILAQLAGAGLAVIAIRILCPDVEEVAEEVLVPHESPSGHVVVEAAREAERSR